MCSLTWLTKSEVLHFDSRIIGLVLATECVFQLLQKQMYEQNIAK